MPKSKHRRMTDLPRRVPRRERELELLLTCERAMLQLRRSFGRPTQRYDFLSEPISQVMHERLILEAAIQGDPVARRTRRVKGDGRVAHPLGN